MRLLRIAYRNLFRNKQRFLITASAMVFAGFIMIFFLALMEGFIYIFERNIVQMNIGDIQVHAEGYRDDPDLYKRIEPYDDLLTKLDKAGFYAAPRLFGFGLAATGKSSTGVQIRGVDTIREPAVTEIDKYIMKGSYLDVDDPHGVVLGRSLARTLNVDIGDEVIIVGQTADGSMANDLYRVRGVFRAVGADVDGSGFFMTESAFRDLMMVPEGVHEIALMRKDQQEDLLVASERAIAIAEGYETKNWKELQPMIAEMLATTDASMVIFLFIFYGAVGMIVLNATLMSVFERIREFGVMKALGVSPFQIIFLILLESVFQVTFACFFALLFGIPVVYYYQEVGMDLSVFMGTATLGGVAFDPTWYCRIEPDTFTVPVFYMYVITAIAVIYPAIKAAVISPVKAIHYR
jgi:ABC-type lipoprotein release transport system permease subunit